MQARPWAVRAGGEDAEHVAGAHLVAPAHAGRHRLVRRPQAAPVGDRDHTSAGHRPGERDDARTRGQHRCSYRRGKVGATVTRRPRVRAHGEAAQHGGCRGQWPPEALPRGDGPGERRDRRRRVRRGRERQGDGQAGEAGHDGEQGGRGRHGPTLGRPGGRPQVGVRGLWTPGRAAALWTGRRQPRCKERNRRAASARTSGRLHTANRTSEAPAAGSSWKTRTGTATTPASRGRSRQSAIPSS